MTKQEPQDGRGVLFVVLMFQDHEHTAQFFLSVFLFFDVRFLNVNNKKGQNNIFSNFFR